VGAPVGALALSTDGRVAVCGNGSALQIWDVASGDRIRSLTTGRSRLKDVAITPDGRYAVSGADDGELRLWDIGAGVCIKSFNARGPILKVSITPDARLALIATNGIHTKNLHLWDLENGTSTIQLDDTNPYPHLAAISVDGRRAATDTRRQIVVWNLETVQQCMTLDAQGPVQDAALTLDGSRLLSATRIGPMAPFEDRGTKQAIKLWDLSSGCCLHELALDQGATAVALTADGTWGLSNTGTTLKAWDLKEGRLIRDYGSGGGGVIRVAVSADGRVTISGSTDGTMRVWDLRNGRSADRDESRQGQGVLAMTADGDRAVSAGEDRRIRVWDVNSGRCLSVWRAHDDTIWDIAVTPDGHKAVSASGFSAAKLPSGNSAPLNPVAPRN